MDNNKLQSSRLLFVVSLRSFTSSTSASLHTWPIMIFLGCQPPNTIRCLWQGGAGPLPEPHIRHQWISITMQYSAKRKMRCIPVLLRHYQQAASVPQLFAVGFAAYLLFMKPTEIVDGKYFGSVNGKR